MTPGGVGRKYSAAPVCAITWRALDLTGPIACSNNQLARRACLNHAERWLATLPGRLSIEQADALETVGTALGFERDVVRRAFSERRRTDYAEPPNGRDVDDRAR